MKKAHAGDLILLIGVPGSGKSTYAASLAAQHEKITVVSSDQIRLEITSREDSFEKDTEVFQVLEARARAALANGQTVVIDATNLTARRRARWLSLPHRSAHAVVFYRDLETILAQNLSRERVVPEWVIHTHWRRLQFPAPGEGFDSITVVDDLPETKNGAFMDGLLKAIKASPIFQEALAFDQRNRHHSLTVGEHCQQVAAWLQELGADDELVAAGLLHDLGKMSTATQTGVLKVPAGPYAKGERVCYRAADGGLWVQSVHEPREPVLVMPDQVDPEVDWHYYGHESAGAYHAWRLLRSLGVDRDRAIRMTQLVQLHMRVPYQGPISDKAARRLRELCGPMLASLLTLREADKVGSGVEHPDEIRKQMYEVRRQLLTPDVAPVHVWYLMRPYLSHDWEATVSRFEAEAQEWERQALGDLVGADPADAAQAVRGVLLRLEPRYLQFNYDRDVQFEARWNAFTLESRGLILERATGRIVARPFPKFFNCNERPETRYERIEEMLEQSWHVSIADKLDGVLGILWLDDENIEVGTRWNMRGTPPAMAAKEMLFQEPWLSRHEDLRRILRDHTLMVEIIHHEHRILVPYKEDQLVLIGGRHNESGVLWTYDQVKDLAERLGLPYARLYENNLAEVLETYGDTPASEGEGIVLMLSRHVVPVDQMGRKARPEQILVKFKWEAYVAAARVVTSGASWKGLIKLAAENRLDDFLATLGDDVRSLIDERVQLLVQWGKEQRERARRYFEQLRPLADQSRADFGRAVQRDVPPELRPAMFAWLDGREWNPYKMATPQILDAYAASRLKAYARVEP